MRKKLHGCLLACLFWALAPAAAYAGDYEKAWEAILKNDFAKAKALLQKAVNQSESRNSALATLMLLENNEGFGEDIISKHNNPARRFSDPNPYWYALWFNDGVLGSYGKKDAVRLANVDYVLENPAFNGSMRAAANYFKSAHYVFSNKTALASQLYPKMGSILNWQYVGAFDNINGSGFDKPYGPITEVAKGKGFNAYNNTTIDWFTPAVESQQGWVLPFMYFNAASGIGYMQTFVESPADQEVILCLGGSGAFKLWLNDRQLIGEPEEKVTELDYWKVRCKLNKGYNRVLVQLGYTGAGARSNFLVRFTDDKFNSVAGLKSVSEPKDYRKDEATAPVKLIPHFAEAYFKDLIAKKPADLVNPLLLGCVYARNAEYDKAKAVLQPVLKKYPDCGLLLLQYYINLNGGHNTTELRELLEKLKTMLPGNYWIMNLEVDRLLEEKDYNGAVAMIDKMDKIIGRKTASTMVKRITAIAYQEKLDSMFLLLEEGHKAFPDEVQILSMLCYKASEMDRKPDLAIDMMEKYLADNYNEELYNRLIKSYMSKGELEKGEAIYRKMFDFSGYSMNPYEKISGYYFSRQQYDSAITYLEKLRSNSPYYHKAAGDIAYSYLQQNKTDKALEYFRKALALHAGMDNYRRQIRTLEGKKDVFTYFAGGDHYARIQEALKKPADTAYASSYIFDEKNVVLYADGASEREVKTAVYVRNNSGIESWKELSLPYNSVYDNMTILKAEVVKANGSKIPAETYQNQVVYAKLEPGDAIFYHYKVNSYGIGRMGREFWDDFYFSANVPTKYARYSVLCAEGVPLQYNLRNNPGFKPDIRQADEFKLYTWERSNVPAFKSEPYMPSLGDFGEVLTVSTVKSWNDISEWYSDITRMQSREDYDLNMAYSEVFPKGAAGLSATEKARRIYQYIEGNIGYSSVSFRQGAYVPQRAGKTLATRLGDCKDMSALFLAFAHKADLPANLVLVNTRNNGTQGISLPSMEFNHCIVQYQADGKDNFLELTDRYLPFGTLPQTVKMAQMLSVPYKYEKQPASLQSVSGGKSNTTLTRKVHVKIQSTDVQVNTSCEATGNLAAIFRERYLHKAPDEERETVREHVGYGFKNHVELGKYAFRNLESDSDTVHWSCDFVVKNEVVNVGDFSMLRPAFMEAVATQNIFTDEERKYPFQYWSYENTDKYVTELTIELPEGKVFDQVPGNMEEQFQGMRYGIAYEKVAPGRLKVTRTFQADTGAEIAPAAFAGMKSFFNKIVEKEQKYISFK
ncbi:DUF3857 domain-containing protein [Chitinophaga caseinilytica]|uniref:DUF3857 domain-containing protein n=1 Tax=Chitinophaga caseinilytica TaxID=2267521 RepID=UPI003C2BD338